METNKYAMTVVFLAAFGISQHSIAGQKSGETAIANPPEAKVFQLPKVDMTGEARDNYIAAKVAQALTKNVFRNGRSHDFGLGSNVPGATKVSYNGQADSLEYRWSWSQGLNYNSVTAGFIINMVEQPDYYEVTVHCPSKLVSSVRDLSLFGIPQWNLQDIGADVSFACSAAQL